MATSTVDTKTEQGDRAELDQETKFPVTFVKRSKVFPAVLVPILGSYCDSFMSVNITLLLLTTAL